ncbi:hypothetical protein RJ641_019399 [Dillenia turbinata]|uniref:BZIP domain-containing protein n=1 Tax=Dillenia turbinata TaxID=194707 RepID=A0AAN8UGS9_9MAGN
MSIGGDSLNGPEKMSVAQCMVLTQHERSTSSQHAHACLDKSKGIGESLAAGLPEFLQLGMKRSFENMSMGGDSLNTPEKISVVQCINLPVLTQHEHSTSSHHACLDKSKGIEDSLAAGLSEMGTKRSFENMSMGGDSFNRPEKPSVARRINLPVLTQHERSTSSQHACLDKSKGIGESLAAGHTEMGMKRSFENVSMCGDSLNRPEKISVAPCINVPVLTQHEHSTSSQHAYLDKSKGIGVSLDAGLTKEEREIQLKKERRRQQNRRSARKSRKLEKGERMMLVMVTREADIERRRLMKEFHMLTRVCYKLGKENDLIRDGLIAKYGERVLSEINIPPLVHQNINGQRRNEFVEDLNRESSSTEGEYDLNEDKGEDE